MLTYGQPYDLLVTCTYRQPETCCAPLVTREQQQQKQHWHNGDIEMISSRTVDWHEPSAHDTTPQLIVIVIVIIIVTVIATRHHHRYRHHHELQIDARFMNLNVILFHSQQPLTSAAYLITDTNVRFWFTWSLNSFWSKYYKWVIVSKCFEVLLKEVEDTRLHSVKASSLISEITGKTTNKERKQGDSIHL